jgi:hypothetical protein
MAKSTIPRRESESLPISTADVALTTENVAVEYSDIVDISSDDSFPASDAPSFTPVVSIGPPRNSGA